MSRTTKLYVGDLKEDVSKEDLEKVFCPYGELRQVWVSHSPPGYAFVDFEDSRDAEDAARALDKRTVLGSRIRVEFSRGSRFRHPSGDDRYQPRTRLRRPFNPSDLCYECGQPGHYAYDCEIRIRRMRNARAYYSPSPYRRRRRRSSSSSRRGSSRGRRYRSRSGSKRRNRSLSYDDGASGRSSASRRCDRRERRRSSGSVDSHRGRRGYSRERRTGEGSRGRNGVDQRPASGSSTPVGRSSRQGSVRRSGSRDGRRGQGKPDGRQGSRHSKSPSRHSNNRSELPRDRSASVDRRSRSRRDHRGPSDEGSPPRRGRADERRSSRRHHKDDRRSPDNRKRCSEGRRGSESPRSLSRDSRQAVRVGRSPSQPST